MVRIVLCLFLLALSASDGAHGVQPNTGMAPNPWYISPDDPSAHSQEESFTNSKCAGIGNGPASATRTASRRTTVFSAAATSTTAPHRTMAVEWVRWSVVDFDEDSDVDFVKVWLTAEVYETDTDGAFWRFECYIPFPQKNSRMLDV